MPRPDARKVARIPARRLKPADPVPATGPVAVEDLNPFHIAVNQFDTAAGYLKLNFRWASWGFDCTPCHDNVHGTSLFGTKACKLCHSAKVAWPRIGFDHDRRTKFPRDGPHATKATCASCHTKDERKAPDRACITCHPDEHKGRFKAYAAGGQTDCNVCHTSVGAFSAPGRIRLPSTWRLMAHVLVVDDEVKLGRLLAEALEGDGHQVTQVTGGRQALIEPSVPAPAIAWFPWLRTNEPLVKLTVLGQMRAGGSLRTRGRSPRSRGRRAGLFSSCGSTRAGSNRNNAGVGRETHAFSGLSPSAIYGEISDHSPHQCSMPNAQCPRARIAP